MEPDRNPADDHDEIDDSQLLAAIERAWPVPPMTGQLISRDWSSVAIDPQAGSFSAPLPPMSLPRFQPRRPWSSFTRVAAVLALLLTSVFGVIAFNNRSDDNSPSFSIAAPSPYESACSLPLRSRDELTQIVTDIKEKIDAGTLTVAPPIEFAEYSTFELELDSTDVQASVDATLNEIQQCTFEGINQAMIEAVGEGMYLPSISNVFGTPNLSVEEAVDRIMAPTVIGGTPVAEMEKAEPVRSEVLTTVDGVRLAALEPDIYGNRYAFLVQQTDSGWQWNGIETIQGEWSSLVITGSLSVTGCSAVRSDETMTGFLQNQSWTQTALPLIAELSSKRLELPDVDATSEEAVRGTVEEFRQCILAGFDPYQFGQSTEAFFGAFANFVGAGPSSPITILGRRSSISLDSIIPSAVTSVIKIDENTALAVLAVDQEWKATGKVPAIILVKVDGQWLINQLAIVQSASS